MPLRTKNSTALSSDALSLMPGWMMGDNSSMFCRLADCKPDSRASIHSRLPLMVFISPLCAIILKGCAKLHVGNVLVEKRECTNAMALVKYGLLKSVK